ncbi:hypothetical protein [Arthrobacter cupressi]|nr:hypothetical protein [Arthrobacter cupressi]NYD77955.1 hypothetical protein [Arthrobacter cupressi]
MKSTSDGENGAIQVPEWGTKPRYPRFFPEPSRACGQPVDNQTMLVHSMCMFLWKAKFFPLEWVPELGKHFEQGVDQKYFPAPAIHSLNAG